MADNLVALRDSLRNSQYWTSKSKDNGTYIQGLKCPECGYIEAWAYSAQPFSINCNRLRRCGARTRTLSIFPERLSNIESECPATAEDKNRPAREYLVRRGLKVSLKGLLFEYWENVRSTGSGAVMFPVGEDSWNGRIFSPPRGQGKTHNEGTISNAFWEHPARKYDFEKPTYVTEGIIDSLSLMEMGYQSIAILSAGRDPSKVDLSEFKNPILAFDNDGAGRKALRKWKKKNPKAQAIMPVHGDWNDLLTSRPLERAKQYFIEKKEEFKITADLSLAETAYEYAEIFYRFYDYAPGLFAFDKCYFFSCIKNTKKQGVELKTRIVSNFTLKVEHFQIDLTNSEEPTHRFHVTVTPKEGRKITFTAQGAELATPDSLRRLFIIRGKVSWRGDKDSSLALTEKIVRAKSPTVRQLHTVGYDRQSNFYVFQEFAIDPEGNILGPDRKGFFRVSHNDYIRPPSHSTIKPRKGIDPRELYRLIVTAWGANGAVAIAFMVASWFVNQVKQLISFFPFLSFYGDTQTGKSRLARILNCMQALDEEGMPMTKLNTGRGEIRTLAQRSGLFKALLEGNKREAVRFNYESILPLYNFGNALQTRALKTNDIQTSQIPFLSSILFVQNIEPFRTKAERERVISLRFKSEDVSKETTEAFNKLIKIPAQEMASFFPTVMQKRGLFEENWMGKYEKVKNDIFIEIGDPRISENHALVLAFHQMLCEGLSISADLMPSILGLAKDKFAICNRKEATNADIFFEQLEMLPDGVRNTFSQINEEEGLLYFNLPMAVNALRTEELIVPQLSLLTKELREHPAFVDSKRKIRMKGELEKDKEGKRKQRRTYVFDISKI